MLQVKEHEEKLIKLYRRFKPEVREKILAFMEIQVTSIKHSKKEKQCENIEHWRKNYSESGSLFARGLHCFDQGQPG